MTRRSRLSLLLIVSCLAASCGGGTPVPTSPSGQQSFLTGTWTGTLTIDREGEPSTSGAATWTFAPVDGTNLQTFTVTMRSQNPWLTTTATVTSAITPSNQPPARISTTGSYPSPRGCTGTMLSVGTADRTSIDADFSGVDCPSLAQSTFRGHVVLSKTGS
jgi:hypothetical protein